MHTKAFALLLLATAAAIPAEAQQGRERAGRVERERAARVLAGPRVHAASRAPRAVLGITTAVEAGVADTAGVLIATVTEDGPAARAGITAGSRLTEINGVSLRISRDDAEDPLLATIGSRRLTRELSGKRPGDEVELRVADGNQTRSVRIWLGDADSLLRRRTAAPAARAMEVIRARMANRASLGIEIGSTGSRRDTLGVFVMSAVDSGPAARAGIFEGARIAAINGVDLRVSREDASDQIVSRAHVQRFVRALDDVRPGEEVELRVWQNGQYRTMRVRTVSSDSLPGARRSIIIGGGARGIGPRRTMIEPRAWMPHGSELVPFRYHLRPELR